MLASPDASADTTMADAAPDATTPDATTPDATTDTAPDRAATDGPDDRATTDVSPTPDVPGDSVVASDAPPDVTSPDVASPDVVDAAADVTSLSCASLPLCDDFETATVGGAPASPRWSVVSPDCAGSGRVTIDGTVAHGGTRSVRIDGGGGYCDHVFFADTTVMPMLGPVVYGRLWVRFSAAFGDGHVTFLTMRDTADGNRNLRMGGQSRIFMWNRESDDATLPELSPAGIARSRAPTAMRWHCVEFRVDQSAGALDTWVDGAAVEGLTVDATPTADVDARWLSRAMWRPRISDVKFGWESYAGQTMTVWFDDVALSRTRIGCP